MPNLPATETARGARATIDQRMVIDIIDKMKRGI
jgi:hypothetical protein